MKFMAGMGPEAKPLFLLAILGAEARAGSEIPQVLHLTRSGSMLTLCPRHGPGVHGPRGAAGEAKGNQIMYRVLLVAVMVLGGFGVMRAAAQETPPSKPAATQPAGTVVDVYDKYERSLTIWERIGLAADRVTQIASIVLLTLIGVLLLGIRSDIGVLVEKANKMNGGSPPPS
jgi:hypothetical protein